MRSFRGIVVGLATCAVATATLARALEVRVPQRVTARASIVVDEVGNVLFGSTPGKVEVTNLPTSNCSRPAVIKDANGTTVGTSGIVGSSVVLATGTGPVTVLRDVDGILVAIAATYFALGGTVGVCASDNLYYESSDCSGPPLIALEGVFYPPTYLAGALLVYAMAPASPRDLNSYRRFCEGVAGACTAFAQPQTPSHPTGTLDLSQFTPPFRLEVQP